MNKKYKILYWIRNNQYHKPIFISKKYFECIDHICKGYKVFNIKRKFLKLR